MAELKESAPGLMGTPKGLRMQIGLFGRRNVGKSSILNAITGQTVSIVSPFAGTTTDPVEKPMELLPLGPVLFIDTAGIDDEGDIGELRTQRTAKVFDRCDLGVLVSIAGQWGPFEDAVAAELTARNIPYILVFNKTDLLEGAATAEGEGESEAALEAACLAVVPEALHSLPRVFMAAAERKGVVALRQALLDNAPEEFISNPSLLGDIVPAGSTVIMVIPIDKEAPKGRIILPQVQVLRDLLDHGIQALCVRDSELPQALESLKEPPALVITDSQAFAAVSAMVPAEVPLTGFSVAFSRFKGDLPTQALGALAIGKLTPESKVLIAESCTHHPIEEDIGTVKIPALLRKRVGSGLTIDHVRGGDFPDNLSEYDLVIHCGGCVFNRRAMLTRIQKCVEAGVPVSNYGIVLAYLNGIFDRAVQPFPGISELIAASTVAGTQE